MNDTGNDNLPLQPSPASPKLAPTNSVTTIESGAGRKILHLVCLILLIIAGLGDAALIIFVAFLVIFAYSGGSNPTSVNGVTFPIAVLIYIFVGIPAGGITYLIWLAYDKTRPRILNKD